ncbi:hypothetical protein [Pseudoxanthomonas mexicana]|uniref:hypothetical protein n=1 Tax=Pseudoxanthomonas mexicana TaxID=128785 RepID=UPI00398BBB04
MANADADITAAYIDGLADAIGIVAFVLGNDKGLAAIIRGMTELARKPDFHKSRQAVLRNIAMQLHDNRTLNVEWKKNLLKDIEQAS